MNRFDRQREEIEVLNGIKLPDFQEFAQAHFSKNGSSRRLLNVQIWSASHWNQNSKEDVDKSAEPDVNLKPILDKQTFKDSMILYPRVF